MASDANKRIQFYWMTVSPGPERKIKNNHQKSGDTAGCHFDFEVSMRRFFIF